jgi:hypothetical protein
MVRSSAHHRPHTSGWSKESDAPAKQRRFEQALAAITAGECAPAVYRYRQGDSDAIDGAPWVYWITSGIRRLFIALPGLVSIAPQVVR